MMAGFDLHSVCARCRDKKKGKDPCVEVPPSFCSHCDSLSAEQKAQLSTPSYKIKKEKRDAKSSTPIKDPDTLSPTLVDPALVSTDHHPQLHLPARGSPIPPLPTLNWPTLTRSGRIASIDWRHFFWLSLWTILRNLSLAQ